MSFQGIDPDIVGISSIRLFSKTPVIVLVVDCCAGALQRESRSSKLSHAQALSTTTGFFTPRNTSRRGVGNKRISITTPARSYR
jgi:hypothetical protein